MNTKVWKFLGLLLIAIFASSIIGIAHAQSVTATIAVASGPTQLAYDSGKGEIFVLSANSNLGTFNVSAISDSTNAIVASVTTGFPLSIAYDSGKGEIFVGCESNLIDVVSDSTNAVVGTITAGADSLVYDSAKGEIFALVDTGNFEAGSVSVSVISDSTNAVVTTLALGKTDGSNIGGVYDSGKGEIFVSNDADNTVSVISDSTNAVVATIPVGNTPGAMAYDSAKGEIFVINWQDSTISVISDSTNKVVATINMASGPTPSYNFESMAYVASKGEIYVETFATSNYNSNSISVISDTTNKVVSTITIGASVDYPQGQAIVYDSAQNEIFMGNGGTEASDAVSVIPLSSTTTTTPTATPTATSTTSTSSTHAATATPKVPEFNAAAVILVAAAVTAITLSATALARKKTTRK